MDIRIAQRIVGLLLISFSAVMLLPLSLSLFLGDGQVMAFGLSALTIAGLGFISWFPVRGYQRDLRLRDGYLVVAAFWLLLGLAGGLPIYLALPGVSVTDAVFESVSGLTTTGASVLLELESLPESVLFYRHLLQWLGGMGVIVLAVAILPILGVGGMSLYRADTPGPVKDTQLTPRIQETVRAIWGIYVSLTALCALAYWAAGMPLLEAVGHAFSTISTGGFSSKEANIAAYDSVLIEKICILFMVLGGINFALHYATWVRRRWGSVFANPEARLYLKLLVGASLVVGMLLAADGAYPSHSEDLRYSVFTVVSVMTSTGFRIADFSLWGGMLPALLIFISIIGGCGGSTAGGIKVMRVYLISKQLRWEVISLIHPSAVPTVKIGGRKVENSVVRSVWGYFTAYAVIYGVLMVVLMALGLDEISAFSAVAATLNNLGPGLGEVANSFASLDAAAKWVSIYAMVLGRLELFAMLVLFTPEFWRH